MDTPLFLSHPGVGAADHGGEPENCDAAFRETAPLGQNRVLRIFWGSQEPGAGCLPFDRAAPKALIQKGDWCGSVSIPSPP